MYGCRAQARVPVLRKTHPFECEGWGTRKSEKHRRDPSGRKPPLRMTTKDAGLKPGATFKAGKTRLDARKLLMALCAAKLDFVTRKKRILWVAFLRWMTFAAESLSRWDV